MFFGIKHIDKNNGFHAVELKLAEHDFRQREFLPIFTVSEGLNRFCIFVADNWFIDIGFRIFRQVDRRSPPYNRKSRRGINRRDNGCRNFGCPDAVKKSHYLSLAFFVVSSTARL